MLSPEDPIPVPQSLELNVDAEVSAELGRALFRRLRDWCAEHNVKLLVVTTGWFAFGDKDPSEPTNAFIKTASGFFGSEGIPFFDPTSRMEAQTTNAHALIWPGDDHPNEKGAELIASSVWGWLRSKLANHSGAGGCRTQAEESLNGVDCFSSLQNSVDPSPVE
jgi:lysophospholipase L1-like esterase